MKKAVAIIFVCLFLPVGAVCADTSGAWDLPQTPLCIACDDSGGCFVAFPDRIEHYSPEGEVISSVEFSGAEEIDFSSGALYILRISREDGGYEPQLIICGGGGETTTVNLELP